MRSHCELSFGGGATRGANWRGLSDCRINNCFLDGNFLTESLQRVLSLELLELSRRVLIQELVQGEVAAANSDFDVVLLDLDSDSLGSKLVDALRLAHEHNLELGPLGVVVDEFSELSVDWVLLDWNVNSDSLL